MDYIDYYKILGVEKTATEQQLKNAYRKLARKYHPDVNPNNPEAQKKFQEVNEANEVLSDPEKRKKYDQYGKDWKHAEAYEQTRQPHGQRTWSEGGPGADFGGGDFSDFFEYMFGGRSRASSGAGGVKFRGEDYHAELQLSLRDAYTEHKQTLTVNGRSIRLTIPAGIENGQTIRIKGHGGPGVNGGPAGDLYLTFAVPNDPDFKREGSNLHSTVKLDLYSALLGGEVTLETLSGPVKISVKSGTQNGARVRLKGKGFPVYKKAGEFGDLYITWSIQIPENLSPKEKELFVELSKMRSKKD